MAESWRRLGSLFNPHPVHYDARRTVAFELGVTGRALRAVLADDRFENGLHEGSDLVLLEVARLEAAEEPATPKRLRELLELGGAALSQMLSRLERIGHVTRRPLAGDRRTYRLTVTRDGRHAARAAGHVLRWADEVLLRELSASEIEVLRDLLSRARGAWRAAAEDEAAAAAAATTSPRKV